MNFFYFFVAWNKDHNHAIIDQPKTQLDMRTACIRGFP